MSNTIHPLFLLAALQTKAMVEADERGDTRATHYHHLNCKALIAEAGWEWSDYLALIAEASYRQKIR
jgi:hypothetical protein